MMQLATSPRSHPPPVPPRPSRQVVAEALKRSTRLPCPTRQAPPPPNTRPWRSEDHVSGPRECRDGRTLVYESAILNKEPPSKCEDVRSASEPREETSRREPASPRRSSSYGNVDLDSRDEKSLVEDSKLVEICQAPNYQNRLAKGRESPEIKSRMSRTNGKVPDDREDRTGRSNGDRTKRDEESPIMTTKSTVDPTNDKSKKDSRRSNDDDASLEGHVTESVLENREKSEDTPRAPVAKENRSLLAKNSDSRVSPLTPTSKTHTRITSTLKVTNDANSQPPAATDDTSLCAKENKDADTTYNGTAMTTISSDDCTTVVVIDEPQRKISFNEDNIQHQDWLEAGVRYSSTKITLPYGDESYDRTNEQTTLNDHQDHDREDYSHQDPEDRNDLSVYSEDHFASIREKIAMSSLQGLPPLPRSLSGFNLNEGRREACEPPPPPTRSSSKTPKNVKSTQPSSSRPSPPGRQLTTLDTQLAILRKEMFGLRQLDLSLLSQLWSLNESIQEFRQLLQEQEDRAPSPSPSSEEGDDTSYGSHPPPPPRRPAPLLHHHRPPRPPRPLRPPASDESPSSEEYGAV